MIPFGNRPPANLFVWLVHLPWSPTVACTSTSINTTNVVTRGWADPQNHSSLTNGQPLEPGESYDVTFDLQPTDKVVQPGQRLGLMILSSDRLFTLRPQPGTELTVDLGGTSLDLPVVGGPLAMGICAEPDDRPTVVEEGVITGTEHGAILKAAAQSGVGEG